MGQVQGPPGTRWVAWPNRVCRVWVAVQAIFRNCPGARFTACNQGLWPVFRGTGCQGIWPVCVGVARLSGLSSQSGWGHLGQELRGSGPECVVHQVKPPSGTGNQAVQSAGTGVPVQC